MRRKLNDLLAKRAGMLTEAETLLKDGKREDYKSKMTEIGNLNDEITEVKGLIEEQNRKFLEKQDTPGEARDKALERADILMKGGEVKFSAAEVRKAITLATGSLAEPTGVGTEIRGGDSPLSSVIDQVRVVNLAGMAEYQEPYVISEIDAKGGTIAANAGKARTASSDPTFGIAQIKPYELTTTSFVDRNLSKLTPAGYYDKIYGMALRALRREASKLILNGDGATSSIVFYGMKTAKNKAGAAIYETVNVEAVDVDLLDTLYFAYGADAELAGSARLFLTKADLKALGALRGTNEKRRLFTIEPDMGNPNIGVIRDGGVVIPYTLCPDLTSLSGATKGSTAIQTMIYGNPLNYEFGMFGDFTVRVDESYKAQDRLLTILGDAMVGGNLVADKGVVVATLPANS